MTLNFKYLTLLSTFKFFQGKYTFDELPYLIFGSLSLLAAVVVYFVPETFGKNLPNTIEEIEGTNTKKDNNNVELADYYNHGQDN